MTHAELEAWAIRESDQAGISLPRHELQLLLMAATGMDKAALIAAARDASTSDAQSLFESAIRRRIQREPVYRILGAREFHGLKLALNEATLEPRDDTECLVELALGQIGDRTAGLKLLDLGTGTGAVALALLAELPNARAMATDIDPKALQMAKSNAELNGMGERFSILESDWFANLSDQFDLIVSNPPYIASKELLELAPEVVRFDPARALDGGEDGLDAYRIILSQSGDFLRPGGCLALEFGYDQRLSVSKLAIANGWKVLQTAQDLAGNDRALCMRQQEGS